METLPRDSRPIRELTRRDLLKAGLTAGAALSTGPLIAPGRVRAQGKRGGMLRVRGYDPPHFDPHLTLNFKTNTTLSFVYSKLVRHQVGAGVAPGDVRGRARPGRTVGRARRRDRGLLPAPWRAVAQQAAGERAGADRRGRQVHLRPLPDREGQSAQVHARSGGPGGGRRPLHREVPAEGAVRLARSTCSPTPPARGSSPARWWRNTAISRRPETAIGTGPFILERYEPNVKTVFRRNPDYFRPGQPSVDGVDWLVMEDDAAQLAAYRTGQIDCGRGTGGPSGRQDFAALKKSHPQLGLPGLPVAT